MHISCKSCTKIDAFLARFYQNLAILQIFLARFLLYLARKASFLVQGLQDLVQNLASLARKILAKFGYFCKMVFTGSCTTGSLGPMNGINKDVSGTRLPPTIISTYTVDFVCFCHLLKTQHCCLHTRKV